MDINKLPKKKILLVLLILLDLWIIFTYNNYACFNSSDPLTGEKISECGDKTYLAEKYSDILNRPAYSYQVYSHNQTPIKLIP